MVLCGKVRMTNELIVVYLLCLGNNGVKYTHTWKLHLLVARSLIVWSVECILGLLSIRKLSIDMSEAKYMTYR